MKKDHQRHPKKMSSRNPKNPKRPQTDRQLTPRQRAFAMIIAQQRAKGKENGVEAAKQSGYRGSYSTVGKTAYENLRTPKICALINQLASEMNQAAPATHVGRILTSAETLARTSMLAYSSAADLLNAKGEFDIADIRARGMDYLLAGLRVTTTTYPNGRTTVTHQFKVEPRKGFLELMGKHHGVWVDTWEDPLEKLAEVLGIPKRLLPAKFDVEEAREQWLAAQKEKEAVSGEIVDESEKKPN
jgi:hypothetical protein